MIEGLLRVARTLDSLGEVRCLLHLLDGTLTLAELLERTRLSRPTTTAALRTLIDRGYVERFPYGFALRPDAFPGVETLATVRAQLALTPESSDPPGPGGGGGGDPGSGKVLPLTGSGPPPPPPPESVRAWGPGHGVKGGTPECKKTYHPPEPTPLTDHRQDREVDAIDALMGKLLPDFSPRPFASRRAWVFHHRDRLTLMREGLTFLSDPAHAATIRNPPGIFRKWIETNSPPLKPQDRPRPAAATPEETTAPDGYGWGSRAAWTG